MKRHTLAFTMAALLGTGTWLALPPLALAEHGGGGGSDHGGGGSDHGGGGSDHGGGGSDHGGGGSDHGGGGSDHSGGGSDHSGGGSDSGGSGSSGDSGGGGSDHGGGGSDSGGSDHGGGGSDSGGSDHGGGGSDSGGSDHGDGGSDSGGSDHGSDSGGGDHGSDGGSGHDTADTDDHGGGGSSTGGDDSGSHSGTDSSSKGDDSSSSKDSTSSGSHDATGTSSTTTTTTATTTTTPTSSTATSAREQRIELATDRAGHEYRAHEIVVMGDDALIARAQSLGLSVLETQALPGLGGQVARLSVPDSQSPPEALARLRAASPGADADLESLYRIAGGAAHLKPETITAPLAGGKIGIVDTGVDPVASGLGARVTHAQIFAGGVGGSAHGSVVAIIAARDGAEIYSANVFAPDTAGNPAATTAAIVKAIDWLVASGVPVINLSLEGPDNAVIASAVARAQARGSLVVAAAGNDGPAAPPAYPAALPQVVAVTAIDGHDNAYLHANRGGYIMFAALGVDVRAQGQGEPVSGTSYAAPAVSALLARLLTAQNPAQAHAALDRLTKRARDLGPPGRDPVFGYGAVDTEKLAGK